MGARWGWDGVGGRWGEDVAGMVYGVRVWVYVVLCGHMWVDVHVRCVRCTAWMHRCGVEADDVCDWGVYAWCVRQYVWNV